MSVQPIPHISFEDWLQSERASMQRRTEYVAGEVFAMAGASEAHNLIVANLVAGLHAQFKGRPCRVYPSDMKVRVEVADVGAYPDVMVICGEREFLDGRRDVVTNPHLIIEVLSESTESYDRGQKFAHYRTLESLGAYLLIAQDRVSVDLYLRQADGSWNMRAYEDLTETLEIPGIEARLELAEIYDKLELAGAGLT